MKTGCEVRAGQAPIHSALFGDHPQKWGPWACLSPSHKRRRDSTGIQTQCPSYGDMSSVMRCLLSYRLHTSYPCRTHLRTVWGVWRSCRRLRMAQSAPWL